MTALVARPPLHVLSTSAMQVRSRRSSARLQEKDVAIPRSNGATTGTSSRTAAKDNATTSTKDKKRKNNYDEEDDGFAFSRVNKNKRSKQLDQDAITNIETTEATRVKESASTKPAKQQVKKQVEAPPQHGPKIEEPPSKRRKKMSFSTPKVKEQQQPVRRSKRLSSEAARQDEVPAEDVAPEQPKLKRKREPTPVDEQSGQTLHVKSNDKANDEAPVNPETAKIPASEHSATKIALPFADTPVIRRNKAMREGKSMKGDRRSSLGMRGRRASSLIEAGNSNALPHHEVDTIDFYKHIESDLMEPRRMRQLLTWCATRAMHAKPKGTDFEDASVKSAARVIEEELLKELSNKSELSDWFSREDIPEPPKLLPERPNPKNTQNLQKIAELEEQINRLKSERDALQHLLQPPKIPELSHLQDQPEELSEIDRDLLSEEDAALLDILHSSSQDPQEILERINRISSSIGPSIDMFADGIHKVAQYRVATENVAGQVLSICADRLANREKEGRRKALQVEEDRSPGRDLSNVLRGLSKVDR